MATVFETRLIGNIGKDAIVKTMDKGIIAINFPVAHNRNWKDKKTGISKTKTSWINCTIWKREGSNLRIVDYLKRGTLVELLGTPFAKAFAQEEGDLRAEIRLNVSSTNILRHSHREEHSNEELSYQETIGSEFDAHLDEFTLSEDEF